MDIFRTEVFHESLDAERRRPVKKDPVETGVEGLHATLAVNARPRSDGPPGLL